MTWLRTALLVLLFCAWSTGFAHAQLRFSWHAAGECPSENDVRAQIARWAGTDRVERSELEVEAGAEGPPWRFFVHIRGDERREHEAADCAMAARYVATIIATAVDPWNGDLANASEQQQARPPLPESIAREGALHLGVRDELALTDNPPQRSASNGDEPIESNTAPRREELATEGPNQEEPARPPWEGLGLAVDLGVAYGSLPEISPRLSVELMRTWGRARFSAGVSIDYPRSTGEDEQRARLGLASAHLGAAARLQRGLLRADLGGRIELGVLAGRGSGELSPRLGYSLWWGIGAVAALGIQAGPVLFRLGAEVLVVVNRPDFVVEIGDERTSLFRASAAVVRGFLGPEVHF